MSAPDFALVDRGLEVRVEVLDGVLDGDDMDRVVAVDLVDDRREVVDLPEPVGPVTSTMPFRSIAISLSCGRDPSSSTVGILFGITRRTTEKLPRCEKTLTRKRVLWARL